MTAEGMSRKLTTILAADVVGYSQLMADDEEGTLSALKACRAITDDFIKKHGGRIFNTAGDAVLAEFNSAVEAVRCAISIQEDLRVRNSELPENQQMWMRIGINVGDVMIDNDDLFGDGVNIAARLEALADKGGICISGSAFNLVKNKLSIAFEDIGDQSVKNIPEPIPAFRLIPGEVSIESQSTEVKSSYVFPSFASKRLLLSLAVVMLVGLAGAGIFASDQLLSFFGITKQHPYDGQWRITVTSSSGCRNNKVPRWYTIDVANGKIDEPGLYPMVGTVFEDGRYTFTSYSPRGGVNGTFQGKLQGGSGNGTVQGGRPSCKQLIRLDRIAKIPSQEKRTTNKASTVKDGSESLFDGEWIITKLSPPNCPGSETLKIFITNNDTTGVVVLSGSANLHGGKLTFSSPAGGKFNISLEGDRGTGEMLSRKGRCPLALKKISLSNNNMNSETTAKALQPTNKSSTDNPNHAFDGQWRITKLSPKCKGNKEFTISIEKSIAKGQAVIPSSSKPIISGALSFTTMLGGDFAATLSENKGDGRIGRCPISLEKISANN